MHGLNQMNAPLSEALKAAASQPKAAFHTPGHKRGQGISQDLLNWLGAEVFRSDLPELPELDNLFAPDRVIRQAQILAAAAFGAEQTWFLVNGSTCGVEAAILATCHPGEKIILPRNVHRSAIAGLILSGAIPIFAEPEYDATWGMAHSIPPTDVAALLDKHPDTKAVMMVYPTYYGVCGDIAAIAQIAHTHNIPLLVDEAHGAHFAFHPDLPMSALAAGADLTVQSIHKTLSGLTQTAMLHVQGTRIDRDRLHQALQLLQSTSPNYLLLASLDVARQQMATQGKALMQQTLALAAIARSHLNQLPGLALLSPEQAGKTPGFSALDVTRLTINLSQLGLTGFDADQILHHSFGVTAELPALQDITFLVTLGNTSADIDQLLQAFQTLIAKYPPTCLDPPAPLLPLSPPPSPFSPRQASFSPTARLPIDQAVGQISAEIVCPYPPGIPVLLPGEQITPAAIALLQQVLAAGGIVTGCADPSLETLKIVKVP
jgi:arginine/lysine/ornithine decarboxylase